MTAGEQAPMPAVQQAFAHRFEDNLSRRTVGIVVVMLEQDDTPEAAVRAAYSAFVRELPLAVADFILTNSRAPETDEYEQIAAAVRPKVRAAARDALSAWEKLQVFLGNLKLDDDIGFATSFLTIDERESVPGPFTLQFEKLAKVIILGQEITIHNHYELAGHFELRKPPPLDPCQDIIDLVQQARTVVDSLQAQIQGLQEELKGASPSEKADILKLIRRIRADELPPAVEELEAAQQALAACRA
jgi:hypothetical protein